MARIVRWTPTNTALDRFFDDLWRTIPQTEDHDQPQAPYAAPAMDLIDGDDAVEVHIDLPGFGPDDVSIEFDKGVLSIHAEREAHPPDDGARYTRQERYRGAFRRTLRLPETLDTENAQANFHNGVLALTLPKRPEAQPLRIPVQAQN